MKILIKNIVLWLLIGSGVFTGTDIITTQKKLKAQQQKETTEFTLTYPVFIKIIMIFGVIMFGYLTYYGIDVLAGNRTGDSDVASLIILASALVACICGVMGTVIWKIEYRENVFIYRNYFGIKRKISANEITKLVDKENRQGQSSFKVYVGDKKVFTIDEMTENMYTFYFWAQRNGVEIEKIQKCKEK